VAHSEVTELVTKGAKTGALRGFGGCGTGTKGFCHWVLAALPDTDISAKLICLKSKFFGNPVGIDYDTTSALRPAWLKNA